MRARRRHGQRHYEWSHLRCVAASEFACTAPPLHRRASFLTVNGCDGMRSIVPVAMPTGRGLPGQRSEVVDLKVATHANEPGGVAPAVVLKRRVDVEFDDERGHHAGVLDRLT